MKFKNYIKSLGFDWTDISILPFFAFTIIFVLEDVRLMTNNVDLNLSQSLWVYILYLVIGLISLFTFIIFEFRNGHRPSIVFIPIVLILLISNVIAIYLNPNTISLDLISLYDNPVRPTVYTSDIIKFIHFCSFAFFILALFVWVAIFPKKFKDYTFLTLICYMVYGVTIVAIIYSLINDDFALLFEQIFSTTEESYMIKDYLPKSFFGNTNGYAIFMEFGLFITLFHHAVKKWNIDYLFASIYYIIIVITLCKTAIISATILSVIHLSFVFAKSLINKNKKELIWVSVLLGLLVALFMLAIAIYFSSSLIREKIDYIIEKASGFTGRSAIWYVANQIISLKVFYGSGHGIYNHLLYNATTIITDESFLDSHNSFLTILGEGGVIYLSIYIALIFYSLFLLYKVFRKDMEIGIALLFGLILFMIHSTFEDLYYYVELIIVFIIICYNISKYQSIEQTEKSIKNEA